MVLGEVLASEAKDPSATAGRNVDGQRSWTRSMNWPGPFYSAWQMNVRCWKLRGFGRSLLFMPMVSVRYHEAQHRKTSMALGL